MNKTDCDRIRRALACGASTLEQERHLFVCPDCRAHVRISQAWRMLPRPEQLERSEPADEAFVLRVLESVRRDRRRRTRVRTSLAAAAALLFFFLAGAAGQIAAAAASGAEDAYAQLIGPSSLDAFLPE